MSSRSALVAVLLAVIVVADLRAVNADLEAVPLAPYGNPANPSTTADRFDPDKTPVLQAVLSLPKLPHPEAPVQPPDDPCLPRLYKDWQEFSLYDDPDNPLPKFAHIRIVIDRSNFTLVLEGIRKDDSVQEIYRTSVALGDTGTPTPEGQFVINHIYCYPDVVFFDASSRRVPALYKGFFAPLLLCDKSGRCQRFRDLGMHGYDPSALHAGSPGDGQETYGAVSAGCIRVPDPCQLKTRLIRLAGLGPLRQNDRGCYHWLGKPVEVLIEGDYPWLDENSTLASIVNHGLSKIRNGLNTVLGAFGP